MAYYIKLYQSSFSRPANTADYASGDIIANSITAGSVVPLKFGDAGATTFPFSPNGRIVRARLRKSGATVTAASFRLHVFSAAPVPVNGDNGALSTTGSSNYIGFIDFDGTAATIFSDGVCAVTAPAIPLGFSLAAGTPIYGLLEARGAYAPASGETFTVALEIIPGNR